MQIINKMVQCSECGCIAFPDAIHCPKCGASYRESKAKREIRQIFEKPGCFSAPVPVDAATLLMETYSQFICPHHKQLDIRTTVIMSSTKCPLCQES